MPRLRTRIVPRGGSALPALTAPTPPTQGPPEAQGTTSVSLTWTHPTAPASGITYALTATDTATGDPVTPSSGSGLGPWVLPVTDGQRVICTLTVTRTADSQAVPSLPYYVAVEQDLADGYPLDGEAGWRTLKSYNLKAQGTQSIPNGTGSITLDGETITTRGATSGGTGTFGTNNTCGLNASDGLYLQLNTTASMLPEVTLTLPLGMTLDKNHALRVSCKVKVTNGDSTDSVLLYVADPSVTVTGQVASTSDVGGWRILGQTATLTYRRGDQASSNVTVPSTYASGSTIWTRMIVPGYGNDVLVQLDPTAYTTSPPAFFGRSQSGPAAPTTTAAVWADGISSIKVMLGVWNGGAGAGLPKGTIEEIVIEVR